MIGQLPVLKVWVDGQALVFKAGRSSVTFWTNAAWTRATDSQENQDKKAALSQREPRDAAVNFDTYRVL